MDDRSIGLVLDASAIVAYTQSSIHVGEVLTQVEEDDCIAALPVSCLVAAAGAVADSDRLDVLVSHPTTELVADSPDDWRFLRAACDLVGRHEAASAAVLALSAGVGVLTCHPGLYAGLDQGGLAVPVVE
jgi:hypothetical protein